jgi:hypothetical protein
MGLSRKLRVAVPLLHYLALLAQAINEDRNTVIELEAFDVFEVGWEIHAFIVELVFKLFQNTYAVVVLLLLRFGGISYTT